MSNQTTEETTDAKTLKGNRYFENTEYNDEKTLIRKKSSIPDSLIHLVGTRDKKTNVSLSLSVDVLTRIDDLCKSLNQKRSMVVETLLRDSLR